MKSKRAVRLMIKALKILDKCGIEATEFIINEYGQAEGFIARSTADKRIGY